MPLNSQHSHPLIIRGVTARIKGFIPALSVKPSEKDDYQLIAQYDLNSRYAVAHAEHYTKVFPPSKDI